VDFSELQRAVQRHMLHADADVLAEVNESAKVPVAIRLGIYSNAYRIRLAEGLGANFPQLQTVLGDEAFWALAQEYIEAHPSTHYSIRWFGSQLEAYLRETRPSQPWFAELAQWEWALASAFDAADAEPLGMDAITAIEPERWWTLRFDLHPSLTQLSLQTNAPAIYKALVNESEPPEPLVLESAQDWMLWRRELTTQFRSTAASETRALQLVRADATFEDLCEALCEWYAEEEVPAQAAGFLKGWVVEGLIVAVR
jgi:hypothetical protein